MTRPFRDTVARNELSTDSSRFDDEHSFTNKGNTLLKDHTNRHANETGHQHHPENHHGGHGHETGHSGRGAHFHHDPDHHGEEPGGRHGGPPGRHGGRGGRGGDPEGGRPEGGRGGPFGGHRGRARRGEARYVLLDALRDGPKHGYEIIKSLEERSGGEYAPSPGTVYPTMQYLEDLGQARSEQGAERRVYHLTEAGRAELEARAEDLAAFWARFGTPATSAASQPEIGFLQEELDNLARTVWGGLRSVADRGDPETIRLVRQSVERCRGETREIIAQAAARPDAPPPEEIKF